MRIAIRSIVFVLFGLAAAGCDEDLSSITGPTPNLEPTFASIQAEIFENGDSSGRVACTSCHTSTGRLPAGKMDLNHNVAYSQLVNVAATLPAGRIRVIPGDPENSYLIHKLEGRTGINGNRMPNNGPPYLVDGQIDVIKRWIEIGAPQ